MSKSILLFFLLLGLRASFAVAENDFKEWGDLRPDFGVAINPPRGRVNREIRQTEKYLYEMIDHLAGAQLRAKGYKFAVSIAAYLSANAMIANYPGLDEQKKFKIEHDKSIRSPHQKPFEVKQRVGNQVLQALEFDPQHNVYRFTVSTQLLRLFKTESELAYVLAHELSHLFEEHLDLFRLETLGRRAQKWWDSQREELIADYRAVEMMVGRYQLRGALRAMGQLANLRGRKHEHFLFGLASSHHHEGVRFSMLQAQIEYLEQTRTQAQQPVDRPLPDLVVINRGERQARHRAEAEPHIEMLLDKARKYPDSLTSLAYLDESDWENAPPEMKALFESPSSAQQGAAILMKLAEIFGRVDSQLNPQQRIDGFLVFALILDRLHRSGDLFKPLTHPHIDRLKHFMGMYSTGPHGWRPEPFLQKLTQLGLGNRQIGELDRMLFQYPQTSDIVRFLIKSVTSWREFANLLIRQRLKQSPSSYLQYAIRGQEYFSRPGEIMEIMRNLTLEALDVDQIRNILKKIEDDDRLLKYAYVEFLRGFQKANTDDPEAEQDQDADDKEEHFPHMSEDFKNKILAKLAPLTGEFQEFRDRILIDYLKQPGSEAQGAISLLSSYGESLEVAPPSEAVVRAIREHLPRHAHAVFWGEYQRFYHFSDGSRFLMSELLRDPTLKKEEKQNILALLYASDSFQRFDEKPSHSNDVYLSRYVANVGDYLATLSIDEFINLSDLQHVATLNLVLKFFRVEHGYAGDQDGLMRFARHVKGGAPPKQFDVLLETLFGYGSLTLLRTGPLHFANLYPKLMETVKSKLDFKTYRKLVAVNDLTHQQHRILSNAIDLGGIHRAHFSNVAAEGLIKLFLHFEDQYESDDMWFADLQTLFQISPIAFEKNETYREHFSQKIAKRLIQMPINRLRELVSSSSVLFLLSPEAASDWILVVLKVEISPAASLDDKKNVLNRLLSDLDLKNSHPDIFYLVQQKWAEQFNLQPFDNYFSIDTRSLSEQTQDFSTHIRGLSGMVSHMRTLSVHEQIQTLDYLMGRSSTFPRAILKMRMQASETALSVEQVLPLHVLISHARDRLQRETIVVRTLVANSFLAGPTGPIANADGMNALLEHLLQRFRPENRELAELMARAVLHAHGETASLAIAYVLAQQSDPSGQNSEQYEADMLNSLFSAFGVPGIKMGQYLAFTSGFEAYRRGLESLQDAAMPISYFAAIELIEKTFGPQWPKHYRVVEILGTGSVNVAVEVENIVTHQRLVAVILRDEIETQTRYNFQKFDRALSYVLQDPKYNGRYDYLEGLLPIIEESVELEFDKTRVLAMHQYIEKVYQQKRRGWTITVPKSYRAEHRTLFVSKAPGVSGRRLYRQNPNLYRQAMALLAEVEFESIRGVLGQFGIRAVDLYINPDFHDGQVYIDEPTKTMTLIDPGQAVHITVAERNLAYQYLRIVFGIETTDRAARILHIAPDILSRAMKQDDIMGRFVQLMGELKQRSQPVPLPVFHFVFAIHRLVELGKRININYQARVTALLIGDQIGIPQPITNACLSLLRYQVRAN